MFMPRSSPPAPANSSTKRLRLKLEPRSTCKKGLATPEHHLSAGPPSALPLNALSGVSAGSHGALAVTGLPVAGRFKARFSEAGGALLKPYTETKLDCDAR